MNSVIVLWHPFPVRRLLSKKERWWWRICKRNSILQNIRICVSFISKFRIYTNCSEPRNIHDYSTGSTQLCAVMVCGGGESWRKQAKQAPTSTSHRSKTPKRAQTADLYVYYNILHTTYQNQTNVYFSPLIRGEWLLMEIGMTSSRRNP